MSHSVKMEVKRIVGVSTETTNRGSFSLVRRIWGKKKLHVSSVMKPSTVEIWRSDGGTSVSLSGRVAIQGQLYDILWYIAILTARRYIEFFYIYKIWLWYHKMKSCDTSMYQYFPTPSDPQHPPVVLSTPCSREAVLIGALIYDRVLVQFNDMEHCNLLMQIAGYNM